MIKMNEPEFLKVNPRNTVLLGEDEIAKVILFFGGARDPNAPTLFQVANVDSGEIKFFMVRKRNKFCLNVISS